MRLAAVSCNINSCGSAPLLARNRWFQWSDGQYRGEQAIPSAHSDGHADERNGVFRLRELIAVIIIILLLLALMLPAVRTSGEAARRNQCNNNLKQIGLALQTYADIHKCFPYDALWGQYPRNSILTNADAKQGAYHYPWSVCITPQIEAIPLYNAINKRTSIWNQSQQYGTGGAPEIAPPAYYGYIQSFQVPPFRCPSDATFNSPADLPSSCMWINYAGSVGVGFYSAALTKNSDCEGKTTAPLNARGMFAFNDPVGFNSVEDGASYTIAAAEVSASGAAAPKAIGTSEYNANPADDLVFTTDADQPLPAEWRVHGSAAGAAWPPPPLAAGGQGRPRAKLTTKRGGTTRVPMIFRASMIALTESLTGTGPCSLPDTYVAAQGGPCGQTGKVGSVAGFELSGKIAGAPIAGIAPLYNALYLPNSNWPGPDSNHPGVVLAVFADGHSTTIQNGISFSIWASLNTRAGGESIHGNF